MVRKFLELACASLARERNVTLGLGSDMSLAGENGRGREAADEKDIERNIREIEHAAGVEER